jgi:hypothetical protein
MKRFARLGLALATLAALLFTIGAGHVGSG